MKSLDQVQPRTAISSLPFTINNSGSYYLTGNLTASGSGAGITVSVDNVTIDLNGFALTGGGGGSVNAINVPAAVRSLSVRNGIITGWSGSPIGASTSYGGFYEKLRIFLNNSGFLAGSLSTVQACVTTTPSGSSNVGISVGSGSTIIGCTSSENNNGFTLGDHCTILDSTAEGNVQGIQTGQNCNVLHCDSSSNGKYGVITSYGCTVADCTTGSNGIVGINVDFATTVRGCTARSNNDGIDSTSSCYIVGNTCDNNAAYGIFTTGGMNRIDGNSCTFNFEGIHVSGGSRNLVIRNSASGNHNQDFTLGTNPAGPIVNMTAGGTISNTNPWANFTY